MKYIIIILALTVMGCKKSTTNPTNQKRLILEWQYGTILSVNNVRITPQQQITQCEYNTTIGTDLEIYTAATNQPVFIRIIDNGLVVFYKTGFNSMTTYYRVK